MMFGALLVFLLCFCDISVLELNTPVIEIPQGKLRGLVSRTHNKYLGIPYASVLERFQAAGYPPKWPGVLEAVEEGKICKQFLAMVNLPIGREDCLFLNIYTPRNFTSKNKLPVMVFVHGGGFYWGGSSSILYEPEPLVAKEVIVVTFNYRLGALGFLCLGIEEAPGNAGLKDQVAALRWVIRNIKYFGGNPKSITIFGESAGAAAVHYLILSKMAKGLFHRAIMESGSSLAPWAFSYDPVQKASSVATRLGYKTLDPHKLLEIFKNASVTDIVRATNTNEVTERYIFTPCAESEFPGKEAFFTKTPKDILTSRIFNKVPMIMGYNNKEGIRYAAMQNSESLKIYDDHFENILPENLVFPDAEERKSVAKSVKQFYFNNKHVNKDNIGALIHYFSDVFFHYSIATSSELHIDANQHDVYNYYFSYDSIRNLGKLFSRLPTQNGASHTDELFYIFQPAFWLFPLFGRDKVMVERMTQLWTNFAKTSNPTPSTSALVPELWIPSNSSQLGFYNLDNELYMRPLPNPERIQFWKELYNKYGI